MLACAARTAPQEISDRPLNSACTVTKMVTYRGHRTGLARRRIGDTDMTLTHQRPLTAAPVIKWDDSAVVYEVFTAAGRWLGAFNTLAEAIHYKRCVFGPAYAA